MNTATLISLPIDAALCDTACRLGGHTSSAEAVQQALRMYVEYLQNHPSPPKDWQPQSIIDLFGKIDYYDDIDYQPQKSLTPTSTPNSGEGGTVPPSQFQTFLEILKESGKIDYYEDYDYKQQRQMR
jgi:hypothetical protein